MSSIGLILRTPSEVESLEANWVPEALGARVDLREILLRLGGELTERDDRYSFRKRDLWLEVEIGDDEPPRSLTAAGVFGDSEIAFLRGLCQQLSARFYDSEEGRVAF